MKSAVTAIVATLDGLKNLGVAGRVGYVTGLSAWTALCLPTTPIELASGFIFPLWMSTFMCVAGKTIGSLVALMVGRHLLKPLITRLLERSSSSQLHQHLVSELKLRPIQTMSILRAAPMPTPFKIYGLALLPAELVPVSSYAAVALLINTAWSLVWSLTGSSATSLQDAVSGRGAGANSKSALVVKLISLAGLLGTFVFFSRFAKAQLMLPPKRAKPAATNGAVAGKAGGDAFAGEGGHRSSSRGRRRSGGGGGGGTEAAAAKSPPPSVRSRRSPVPRSKRD